MEFVEGEQLHTHEDMAWHSKLDTILRDAWGKNRGDQAIIDKDIHFIPGHIRLRRGGPTGPHPGHNRAISAHIGAGREGETGGHGGWRAIQAVYGQTDRNKTRRL